MKTSEEYQARYQFSIEHPQEFWAQQAEQRISWIKPWTQVLAGDMKTHDCRWFVNGELNACFNCIDRHLDQRADQIALIWEGNDPRDHISFTYQQLHEKICQFANVLISEGVQKGDRVCIYLPMIPEVVISILACARIGAIHSVIFAGYSPDAIKTRMLDAGCRVVITADAGQRGEKITKLKDIVDQALTDCPDVTRVITVMHTGQTIQWHETRDAWYHQLMQDADKHCPITPMDATDPLFILYTSGSTGIPKGVLHSTGGYLVYVATTFAEVFQYQPNDIYWCTADIGWITGHSYLIYGPLANGATTLLFEGILNYPTFSRYWDIIDKYQVNQFYTSPTALRTLRREGDHWLQSSSRQSLKILGAVGETFDPQAWDWYYERVGHQRCPIVNTWWQTESGGVLITPLPHITANTPGTVGVPLLGIIPDIVDDSGQSVPTGQTGQLVIKKPWPGMMQTIYGNHERFIKGYFEQVPGCYFTGDGAYRDTQNLYWITGRNDDVLNISGHRISSAEIENALITHPTVAEAAVVGIPDEIKGEQIYAFVTLKIHEHPSDTLKKTLVQYVRDEIGHFSTPETIQWTTALPKTRSGKIVRRILRKIANREFDDLGDTSTLADLHVLKKIIGDRK